MGASRVSIVAFLIVAVIFGAAQCMALCVAQDCNSAAPPCHQHHRHATSASCAQDFQLPDIHRSSTGLDRAVAFLPPAIQIKPSVAVIAISRTAAFSPPDSSLSSSTILRI
jgi:hypothetical protein